MKALTGWTKLGAFLATTTFAKTWMRGKSALCALAIACFAQHATAAECQSDVFEDATLTWCSIDLQTEPLRLWLLGDDELPIGTFERLESHLATKGQRLGLAMNAGMYHDSRAPVGHYVEDGTEKMRVVTSEGPGNFGLLPNGVFCWGGGTGRVIESRAFAKDPPTCRFATQSGPMLVIDGALHPRFIPDSDSRKIRNGVGMRSDGTTAILAISETPVNFHLFARFFRDVAGTPNALFLDGSVSQLVSPETGHIGAPFPLGPIMGIALPDG